MDLIRRLLARGRVDRRAELVLPVEEDAGEPDAEGIRFRDLIRQLSSADERGRRDVALMLSALGHRGAIRPLIRAYLAHGDQALLDALSIFGGKVTTEVAREMRDIGLGPTARARLMDVLGHTGDPGAATIARPVARSGEVPSHVAACLALARLGEPEGVHLLAGDLMALDESVRLAALEALLATDAMGARAAVDEHLSRYLGAAGALPAPIGIAMPLLIDPDRDLAGILADRVRRSPRDLTVIAGPYLDRLAEGQRDALTRALPGYRLLYVTARHSPDEQATLLSEGRRLAASRKDGPVVLLGRLASPEGRIPLPNFLVAVPGVEYSARVIIVGPRKLALPIAWWRYLQDRAEVPAELEVVITSLVLGRSELTPEEHLLYDLAGEESRDAFARAFLAHL